MTDECLIWSGNEEVWPYREQAKPAPRGHKVAQVGEAGGAKLMERLNIYDIPGLVRFALRSGLVLQEA